MPERVKVPTGTTDTVSDFATTLSVKLKGKSLGAVPDGYYWADYNLGGENAN
jgi:hypothetical protein